MLSKKIVPILMALLLGISMLGLLPVYGAGSTLKCYSDVTQLGNPVTMNDVIGTTFKVAVVIENVTNLYGYDMQFNWTTDWIHYTDYTITSPVETYNTIQTPSPYAGILHKPVQELTNVVNESDHIELGEEGAMAWIAYSSKAPAGSFNGSGTCFVFDFIVIAQPYDYEEPSGVTVGLHFVATALSNSGGGPIVHSKTDWEITLYPRTLTYPASPMLKVTPESVDSIGLGLSNGSYFDMQVWLMGADGGDLSSFWDVAGVDFHLNYNASMLEGTTIVVDPDGSFGNFWQNHTFVYKEEFDNTAGYAWIAFTGFGSTHTPVHGTLKIATVTFRIIYAASTKPSPTPITLENPLVPSTWYIMDADGGIIDLGVPVGTDWTGVFPNTVFPIGFNITSWSDEDGNGKLSVGDQVIILNKETSKWYDYKVDDVTGTLQLQMKPFHDSKTLLVMDGPTNKYTPWPKTADTGTYYDTGYGNPYWTGNFSLPYPVDSVNYIEVQPQIGAAYNLTETTDFVVNPDGTIWLKTPLDEEVLNESVGTMPIVPGANAGWPPLVYIASGISSCYVVFPNGTSRYANNYGFEEGPPAEWWFEPDFPYELESWWATGYMNASAPYTWPDGTEIYVNYTAPAFIYVDYNAPPDPLPYFMEWTGDYADFLTIADPTGTSWHQVYPSYSKTWDAIAWNDADSSGDLTVGDTVTMNLTGAIRPFNVTGISTDIKVIQKPCVQDVDTTALYYCDPRIVDIAGYPHPDRPMSPWFGRDYGIPLPNAVENANYTPPFAGKGRCIDVYTQYPDGYNGKGPGANSDAFGPQATVILTANVTYNKNPVQHKPVTFDVYHENATLGQVYHYIFCNFTDEYGIARVKFGLPWPCVDPEDRVFGTWDVTATVNIRDVVVSDDLSFEVGWLIDIVSLVSKDSYAIGEHMSFTITYNSISLQPRTVYFSIVVTDDLDVPIAWWVVYSNTTISYGTHTITLQCIPVPKWTFVGMGKVWANILTKLPTDGGVQYCPEETIDIGLTIS